jgi:hypothetical protein
MLDTLTIRMKLFKKLSQEIYHYRSDSDIESLKLSMTERFTNSNKLGGKFSKNYEFECWPIGEMAHINRHRKPIPLIYILGELIPNNSKTVIVICLVTYAAWVPLICSLSLE